MTAYNSKFAALPLLLLLLLVTLALPGIALARSVLHMRGSADGMLTAAIRRQLLQSECSTTDASADAVFRCTNAVRQNPSLMSNTPCWSSVQASVTNPPRNALSWSGDLGTAAQTHTDRMAAQNLMSHQLPGEPDTFTRIRQDAPNYSGFANAENVAAGYTSARDVVSGWFCSEGHRVNIFSCDSDQIGVGSNNHFYTQVFGCSSIYNCNSCSTGGSGGSTGGGSGGSTGGGSGGSTGGGSGGSTGGGSGGSTGGGSGGSGGSTGGGSGGSTGGGSGGSTGGGSTAGACTRTYTVTRGDTCWLLWTINRLSEQQFKTLNPGINCSNLQVGQSLCLASSTISGGASGSSGTGPLANCRRGRCPKP